MKHGRSIVGLAGAGVVAAGLLIGALGLAARGRDGAGAESADRDRGGQRATYATAEVTRRSLEQHTRLPGTLGYGERRQVSLSSGGTITALPPLGTVVDRGGALLEVDGRPVVLLLGDRPMWRGLAPGIPDGPDIEQLEANLVALGHASASTLTVDAHWTAATTTAVKAWQRALGRQATGAVQPGEVVVLPSAVRIAGHPTPVGGPAAGPVLDVTGTGRLVTMDLEADRQGLVTVDQAVQVELPDGTRIPGRITNVGRVVERDQGGQGPAGDIGATEAPPTLDVTVELDDPDAAASLDEAPVSVLVVTSAAEDVLAVPVHALLALADGGFAVERVEPEGTTRMIDVETSAFADGWVEVAAGELAEGDEVVVPDDSD